LKIREYKAKPKMDLCGLDGVRYRDAKIVRMTLDLLGILGSWIFVYYML